MYTYNCRNAVHIMVLVEFARKLDLNSDIDLMLRIQKGEIDFLGILFERYKMQLFGFFFRTTGNRTASEDMVQNVFLRILKYKDKFSGYGKFTSWMYQIARNVSFDYFKKNSKYEISDELDDINEDENSQPDQALISDESTKLLNTAMMRLSEDKREVLVLSKYQELKYKEIAEILNCSEVNVKVKVFRALSELKQVYSQLEE